MQSELLHNTIHFLLRAVCLSLGLLVSNVLQASTCRCTSGIHACVLPVYGWHVEAKEAGKGPARAGRERQAWKSRQAKRGRTAGRQGQAGKGRQGKAGRQGQAGKGWQARAEVAIV